MQTNPSMETCLDHGGACHPFSVKPFGEVNYDSYALLYYGDISLVGQI